MTADLSATEFGKSQFCAEATWVEVTKVIGSQNLRMLVRQFNLVSLIGPVLLGQVRTVNGHLDMYDVKEQEKAKRAI